MALNRWMVAAIFVAAAVAAFYAAMVLAIHIC